MPLSLPLTPSLGHPTSIAVLVAATVTLTLCFIYLSKRTPFPANAPQPISSGNYPILGTLAFFSERWDLFQREGRRSNTGAFSFNVGNAQVIGITKNASSFFENPRLSLGEGQTFLFGAGPLVQSDNAAESNGSAAFTSYFTRRLTALSRPDSLVKRLPLMIRDVRSHIDGLAASPTGVTNTFDEMYSLVFRLTMRTLASYDIADDAAWSAKTLSLFETVGGSFGATTVILPWLPTPSMIKRTTAGGRIYVDIQKLVNKRLKKGQGRDDALGFLVDQGDSMKQIIAFVMAALFAGQINTGINAGYLIYCLATHPEWMAKARKEVETVAKECSIDQEAPLIEQLSSLTLDKWESQFPILEVCLRECIRHSLVGSAIRKNVDKSTISIGDAIVPAGGFVVYNFAEPHLDSSIYSDPQAWDPSRYDSSRAEDKKMPHSYIGWGSGRHPCLGMKLAKLEVNIITALLLARFDEFSACDHKGELYEPLAAPTVRFPLNALGTTKPRNEHFVKLHVREM